ncbi:MAG: type III pantothenate kinase [Lentimonas sp.]|jgi:type III pantothenate kinase
MLLAIDIGNTNIVFGIFQEDKLLHKFRLETVFQKSEEDYAVEIVEAFLNQKIDCLKILKVVISSVVPNLTSIIEKAVHKFYSSDVFTVGSNLKLKINNTLQNKQEVGFDRLLNSIAGYKKFGGNLIIVDFGTATTFDIVGKDGEYLGGIIAPGVDLSIKALHEATAQLPKIQLKSQNNVIGKSTSEAMNSGIYFGYISLIEGLVEKIKVELGCDVKLILTGGLSNLFKDLAKNKDHIQPDLTLEGLRLAVL